MNIIHAVKSRIKDHGPGWCFTTRHFEDFKSDTGVRTALVRLQKENYIRRLAQGIYEYPIRHKVLGIVPPDIAKVAQALAERNGHRIQPSGAHAANLTGISEQVPAKVIFLTDGPSKKIKIGNTEIVFKKASPRVMSAAGTKEGLVIQAFKFMKRENINEKIRGRTRKFLEPINKKETEKNMKSAPAWIRTIIFETLDLKK